MERRGFLTGEIRVYCGSLSVLFPARECFGCRHGGSIFRIGLHIFSKTADLFLRL